MVLRKIGRWLSGLTRRHRVGNLSTRLLNGAAKNTFNKATTGPRVRPSSSQGNRRGVNVRNGQRAAELHTRLLNGAAKNTFNGNRRGVNVRNAKNLTNANVRNAKSLMNELGRKQNNKLLNNVEMQQLVDLTKKLFEKRNGHNIGAMSTARLEDERKLNELGKKQNTKLLNNAEMKQLVNHNRKPHLLNSHRTRRNGRNIGARSNARLEVKRNVNKLAKNPSTTSSLAKLSETMLNEIVKRVNDKAASKREAERKRINKAESKTAEGRSLLGAAFDQHRRRLAGQCRGVLCAAVGLRRSAPLAAPSHGRAHVSFGRGIADAGTVNEAMSKESTRVIEAAIQDGEANVYTAKLLTMPITKVGHISILQSEGKGALKQLRALALFPAGSVSNVNSLVTAIKDRTLAKLESLDLYKCGIDATMAKTLARAFRLNTMQRLESLDLDDNEIGDDGVRELAGVMSSLPSLAILNLAGNNISDEGFAYLLDSMSKGWLLKLANLDLMKNPAITEKSLDLLAGMIRTKRLPYLERVYIDEPTASKDLVSVSSDAPDDHKPEGCSAKRTIKRSGAGWFLNNQ